MHFETISLTELYEALCLFATQKPKGFGYLLGAVIVEKKSDGTGRICPILQNSITWITKDSALEFHFKIQTFGGEYNVTLAANTKDCTLQDSDNFKYSVVVLAGFTGAANLRLGTTKI